MLEYNSYVQIFSTIIYSITIIVSLLCYKFLKDKSERVKRIPLYIIGILIIIFEIGKQVRNACGYNYRTIFGIFLNDRTDFDAYALPFHFCSFFIFWIIFDLIFIKNKRLSAFFDNMTFLWASFIFVLVFFYPQMIYGEDIAVIFTDKKIFHSIYFHILVVLYFGVALALRTYKFEIKKIYQAPLCMLLYGTLAIPAAHIFKKNFCSIYSPEGWGFLEPVFAKGYVVYDGLLIIIGIVLSIIIFLSIIAIGKLRDKVKDNRLYLIGYKIMVPSMFILLLVSKLIGYEKLQPKYCIFLTLVAFLCELPATIKGHIINNVKGVYKNN